MYEFNVHTFVSILVFRVPLIHLQLNDYKRFTYFYLLTYFLLTYIYTNNSAIAYSDKSTEVALL